MQKTKIDWADSTWNPVTGCYHNCKYCYARKIATRFDAGYVSGNGDTFVLSDKAAKYIVNPERHDGRILMAQNKPIFKNIGILEMNGRRYAAYPFGFCPTFHSQRIFEPRHIKKPQNIFVCSMADLFGEWVPDKWIQEVFKACETAPWHNYLFLTKNPARYARLARSGMLPEESNYWYGATFEHSNWEKKISGHDAGDYYFPDVGDRHTFVSFEPLLQNFNIGSIGAEWVIIGAETGNRKGKVIPEREWVQNIVDHCRKENAKVFMKESLRELMGVAFIQEYPEGLAKEVKQ